ncbi:MAG: lysylphosphatidylglycerol synthase domain-containing protein [Planctomycetia bacterium]|nr:lysylphosphatidylglycerol synthase domain-containing protein [Planctomycetia bacterium]
MPPERTHLRKLTAAAVKLLVVAVVFWFVSGTIFTAWKQLRGYSWQIRPGWLVASAGLYLLGLLPAGLFWHRVLKTLGQDARLGETLRAYYIGHLGKYVPGKAMVVVLRAGLIRSHRVSTGVAAVSVFFETLTMMSVGAFISAAILAARFREQRYLCLVALGLMVGAGLPIVPPIFRRLARWAGVGRSDPATAAAMANLGWRSLAEGVVAMTLAWVLLGTSLWAVLRAMDVPDLNLVAEMPLYVASVSLAMVAGFLSLIPGGLGVRDLILVKLVAPQFGDVAAAVSAVFLRLVWLVAELAISAILYFVRPGRADILQRGG